VRRAEAAYVSPLLKGEEREETLVIPSAAKELLAGLAGGRTGGRARGDVVKR